MSLRLRAARALTASVLALVVSATAASSASAYIYWSENPTNTIERANLDGTNTIALVQGAASPAGVAVSGDYVYWANFASGTIGRANIDGTGVNQDFIVGGDHPLGVAVEGNAIYWTNSGNGLSSVGRANLDGSSVNQSWVTFGSPPWYLASDSNYIYVTERYINKIARIPISNPSAAAQFIATDGNPTGIAVNSSDIYWTDTSGHIAEATIGGTVINTYFQHDPTAVDGGGLALDSNYIYWAESSPNGGAPDGGTIGRATLNDYNANMAFTPCCTDDDWGVAVDSLAPPPAPGPGPGAPGPGSGVGPSPPPPGPATHTSCVVPKLKGMTIPQARKALAKADCRVGKVTKRRKSHARHGRVIGSTPAAGKHLQSGSRINLLVAR